MFDNVAQMQRQADQGRPGETARLPEAGRSALFDELARGRLNWLAEEGFGYYPVVDGIEPYNRAYFDRYAAQADTPIGRKLMQWRVDFVGRHWQGEIVDVGIGSGAFIAARLRAEKFGGQTFGFDVNPAGVEWLRERNLFRDVYEWTYAAVTLWDTLEHIPDFRQLLQGVFRWVFVSIPIFEGPCHALASKHFRRDEHCWYFTREGLTGVFDRLGFDCVERSNGETEIGREGIESFAFKRRWNAAVSS